MNDQQHYHAIEPAFYAGCSALVFGDDRAPYAPVLVLAAPCACGIHHAMQRDCVLTGGRNN